MRRPSASAVLSFLTVAGASLFILFQLAPSLLVANTTPAGGDMGAHVWGPAYMRDHLLPHGRLTGWTPDWYAGFPAFTFYFPLPSLLIVLLDVVLPYGVAFKLITVLGLVTLPVAVWAFGRLAGMSPPMPAFLAVAAVPFLFEEAFSIYGGNIPSTLAGEFAFSISLSFGFVFLGFFARGLETGRHRALSAVLLAVTGLCHVIPTFFVIAGAIVLLLLRLDRHRLRFAIPVFAVAGLLAAFWIVPFLANLAYTTDMGWEKITQYKRHLLGYTLASDGSWDNGSLRWVIVLAAGGATASLLMRRRAGTFLTVMALVSAATFVLAPQGRLWNARVLPFWFLCVYLLAAIALAEASGAIAAGLTWLRDHGERWQAGLIGATAVGLALVVWVLLTARDLWTGDQLVGLFVVVWLFVWLAAIGIGCLVATANSRAVAAPVVFAPLLALVAITVVEGMTMPSLKSRIPIKTAQSSYIPAWVKWNYSGYERKDAYPEYHDVVQTMADVGRRYGCGRAMWEYESELDRHGTPMALMLLPYWTGGCIGSMEGLFFESASSTPYHFLNQSELSLRPSRAQRDLDYRDLDVARGVEHLQLLGVRYYMALSPEAQDQARANPDLGLVATSGPWHVQYCKTGASSCLPAEQEVRERTWEIYEVRRSAEVAPLEYEPVVMTGVDQSSKGWLEIAEDYYQDATRWQVPLAADGPREWARVRGADADPPRQPVTPASVSRIKLDDNRISFDVDRVGSPVLVKASYFPNWKASGARGPWRVTPNLMVVVPTKRHVELHYGSTAIDIAGGLLTLLGLAAVAWLWRRGRVDYPPPEPEADATAEPGNEDAPAEVTEAPPPLHYRDFEREPAPDDPDPAPDDPDPATEPVSTLDEK